jgi:potassium-transporting ATPase KdpC subunit
MTKNIRSNLLLFGLSIAICCVAYPLVLWALGWALFPSKAEGSLIRVKASDGTERIVGSRQIAQPFTAPEYFWPRPSAASYNGAVASGSNWGANQPKLRDRAAQQLGGMVVYKAGSKSAGPDLSKPRTPQDDIAAWVAAKPDRAADWANEYSVTAVGWAKTDLTKDEKGDDKYGLQGEYIAAWARDHLDAAEDWKKSNPGKEPRPEDLVGAFFNDRARTHPGQWPGVVEKKDGDKVTKSIEVIAPDSAVAPFFFDAWLQDPANADKVADLEPVPADMVTASGAGLDPHITVRNAMSVYQLDRVAAARAGSADIAAVRDGIARLIQEQSFTPLSGLAGEPLVNVLELNLALDEKLPVPRLVGY